ncbi:MAG: GvpL/GvpF family gas vesicle protein [Bryobacteraceae bacterium]|jgi:hypothetical protein
MKHLLYCIFEHAGELSPEPGMRIVAAHGLAAAVSEPEEPTATPSVAALLAFEKVVEAIHSRRAVIPLRYGCRMESAAAVVDLLERRQEEYLALLARLQGMAEMGIRVLCPRPAWSSPESPLSPGAAYLASLGKRYGAGSSFAPEETQLADRVAGSLAGYYLEQQREIAPAEQGRLVSLYFLTPKIDIARFQNKAREIRPPSGTKLLLSGPWPPYNFAASLD